MKRIFYGLSVLAVSLLCFASAARANPFEYTWQKLAPDVWAAIRQDPFELPQEGNAVFVVTNDGVVLFDAGGSPLMGESIVAKVRSVTDKPITHVVISHWHGDHMRGLQSIQKAFPQVHIYAHPFSRDMIAANTDNWLKRRVRMVPGIRKAIDASIPKGVDFSGRPLIPSEKDWILAGQSILEQLDEENNRTSFVIPTETIADQMTLRLGGKTIEFEHLGDAHTAGDLIMWLPQRRIVATGDIVTGPVPLMQLPHTNGYVAVLEKIKGLHFKTLVPGHGSVMRDAKYVDLLEDTFLLVSKQMGAAVADGLDEKAAASKIDLSPVEERYTHGDSFLKNRFLDYVSNGSLPHAAFLVAKGQKLQETF